MEKQRRVGKGTLSELFGKEGLAIDKFMRSVGLYKGAKDAWEAENFDKDTAEAFQAFSDGVNDYVQGISLTSNK